MVLLEEISIVDCNNEKLFNIYRDKIDEFVRLLPIVEDIKKHSAEVIDGKTYVVRIWTFDTVMPSLLSSTIPEHLKNSLKEVIETSVWNEENLTCAFKWTSVIDLKLFTLMGITRFEVYDDNKTKMITKINLKIIHNNIPLPNFIIKVISPLLETFVTSQIRKNLQNITEIIQNHI